MRTILCSATAVHHGSSLGGNLTAMGRACDDTGSTILGSTRNGLVFDGESSLMS